MMLMTNVGTRIQDRTQGRWSEIFSALGIDVGTGTHRPCPSCGGKDRFRFDDYEGRGTWICNQCDPQAGDGFSLVMNARHCDFKRAVQLIEEALGDMPVKIKSKSSPDQNGKGSFARALWMASVADAGRIASYLMSRGLSGKVPESLKTFSSVLYRDSTATPPKDLGSFPVMIGQIVDANGEGIGAHVSYLDNEGPGKAPVPEPKKSRKFGDTISGGAIRLHDHKVGVPLILTEGIETALACYEATGWPVWACVSANGLESVVLPESIKSVYVAADLDRSEAGQRAAERLAARLHAEERSVRVVMPTGPIPEGCKSIDWLDVLNTAGAKAVADCFAAATPWSTVRVQEDGEDDFVRGEQPLDFPQAAWRGVFEHYRLAMDGTSEAPDAAHFAALWAIAAVRLRRRISFYYAGTLYANVFLVHYGATGESKTSASRQALRLLPDDGRVKILRGVGSAEALGDWMQQSDEGPQATHLLWIEELAGLLTRGKWEGSTLLEFLTQTFDAPPIYEVPFRKNPVRVEEPTPTLIAGTTPEWFWRGMPEVNIHGGFGNRLFFFTGIPKPPIPMPAKPNMEQLAHVQNGLNRLESTVPRELDLHAHALDLWKGFYFAWKSTEWDPLTTAAIRRVPTYVIKLAMTYAALEETTPLITREQIEAAIQVGHYGARCADQLMQKYRNRSVQGECEQRVMKVLETEDLVPWQIHRRIGGRFSAEERNRALRALKDGGLIVEIGKTRRNEPILRKRGRTRKSAEV